MRSIDDNGGGGTFTSSLPNGSGSSPSASHAVDPKLALPNGTTNGATAVEENGTTPADNGEAASQRGAVVSDQDLRQLWSWNEHVPDLFQQCMHDIISEQGGRQPEDVAVVSWDGSLKYGELEDLSSRLARHLLHLGVGQGVTVPLCFEKSMWAVVALLGIMKTGAAFSLTDPSQPEARLRTIVEQTGAKLIVTSALQSQLGQQIAGDSQVLAVSSAYFETVEQFSQESLPSVPSSAPMYIIFTSGSTGKPKGVVISHENYTSGAIPRAAAVGYKSSSRVFDFPSYAFDVSIDCMLCTLALGGQICVPSEEGRMNDLSGAIRDSKANMVHMTPSVARVLDSDIIPSLDVLGLGGEAISASDAAAWGQYTNLVIAYGPSECTVGCTINNTVAVSTGIGKGVGGTTWIVDPEDHNILVPVGGVGELLVEGPVVGIGYLDEPVKTAEVFIEDPTWLTAGYDTVPGRRGRLYKTGDLVRYESNGLGSIEFVGRKDQQVKLRGQRVELTEVEHHLQSCLPAGIKVAAEVIKPENGSPTLVAFLSEPSLQKEPTAEIFIEPSPSLATVLETIDCAMGAKVPRYMVPAAFVTLSRMPSLVSGKTDRKTLREIGLSIPRSKLGNLGGDDGPGEVAETEAEKSLQNAWLAVLGPQSRIFKNSNFFGLGGDSLRAMKLVAAARDNGIVLTVADIFTSPSLEAMAKKASTMSEQNREELPAFSLLDKAWPVQEAVRDSATLCGIETSLVEDVYPCTPLQEALMALSAKVKEAYVAQRVVGLKDTETAQRLINAFDTASQGCPILRTRIVQVPGRGLVQVVVKGKLQWHSGSDLAAYLQADRDATMELGAPLIRYAVINDATSGKVSFVLTMHHALYDGWSMPLVVDRVNKAYQNQNVTRPAEFKHFIKYLAGIDRKDSEAYWREQLHGASRLQFPQLPHKGYQTKADSLLEEYVSLEQLPKSNATVATVIRAAWALVASQYINSADVVFGETLTGRNAPIIGAEEIEGPMITTVPVRVVVDRDAQVSEFLQAIQEQTVEQISHEHFGLQHIRKLSADALEACELRTGLVLHPSTAAEDAELDPDMPANHLVPAGDAEAAQEALKFNTYALMLVCSIDPKGFLVMASFDSNTIAKDAMQRVLNQFKNVAQTLCVETAATVGSVDVLTQDDMASVRDIADKAASDPILAEYSPATAAYIVHSQDPSRVLPRGAVGEIVLQSASELALAKAAAPSWVGKVYDDAPCTPGGAFYATGKLGKYDATGRICIIGDVTPSDEANSSPAVTKPKISATSQRQRKLRALWSRVLNIPEQDISLDDNFFLLGGDSISAMKLASEARPEGIRLSVAQMFSHKTLQDMASVMEEAPVEDSLTNGAEPTLAVPFSLLDGIQDTSAFVDTIVEPQLADPSWTIVDVLPTRPLQQLAVKGTTDMPRFSARYELMFFDAPVDIARLRQSCQDLIAHNEILRTVFVEHNGTGYSAVLDALLAPFEEHAVPAADADLSSAAKDICRSDALQPMPLGSSFVKFLYIQAPSSPTAQSCLVFRISHAQYDEMCLPLLLRQLSQLYTGTTTPEQSTPYSSYVSHVLRTAIPSSTSYWRDLLADSSITQLRPAIPVTNTRHHAIERTLDISSRRLDTTVASIPTAAWALCLARRAGTRDVTFGEVVSGRSIDLPGGAAHAVTGPCWQYVPFRVRFEPHWTASDLLSYVQGQHISSAAHESLSLEEIARLCCPSWTPQESMIPGGEAQWWFDTVVHQDVSHVSGGAADTESAPTAGAGAPSRYETLYAHEEPLREWKVQAFVHDGGKRMTLEIVTLESWAGFAAELLDELVEATRVVVAEGEELLF
ncbi:NRPS [Lecanicillium sp. MT-2017a]|nr:NRPS [Lecanicillium sp. MT-2017a]